MPRLYSASVLLASGARPLSALSASSWWDSAQNRAHSVDHCVLDSTGGANAWCAGRNVPGEWIELDCGSDELVTAVLLQGRGSQCQQWCTRVEVRAPL
jgi:hypothetical protein